MKNLLKVGIVLSVSFGLSGCSSTDEDSKTRIEIFSGKSENQMIFRELVEEYERENPDIDIVFTSPADAGTVLRTRLVKDDIPNVIAYGGDFTYTELADVGMLEDLSQESFVSNLAPSYVEITKDLQEDQDQLYGVPYAANASGVIYNIDLFEEYNLALPQTWDEFITVCQVFQENGITPIEGTFKDAWTLSSIFNPLAGILSSDDFMQKRKNGEERFVDKWQPTLEKLAEIMTYTQKDAMGTSYADGIQAVANGEAAMLINGTWAVPEVIKANPEANVKIFALPASNDLDENLVISGVDVMLMVGKDTPNRQESINFIEFLLEDKNAQKYSENQFSFSGKATVTQEDPLLSDIQPLIEAGKVNDFIDHLLPNGYDLGALLSEFALNQTSNPEKLDSNIKSILEKMDSAYDAANID